MESSRARRLVFGALAAVIALPSAFAAVAVDRSIVDTSLAQAQDTEAVGSIQTPPPVPGLEYPDTTTVTGLPLAPGLIPGTPVVPGSPADSTGTAGIAESGGDYETNLGGSDVAVASEGGSYQVDGPKRKGKRMPTPMPKP